MHTQKMLTNHCHRLNLTLLIGVTLVSLTVSGCASTNLTAIAPIEIVIEPTPQLTIEPSLLVIQPTTPLPPARKNTDWRLREQILDADNERDRGQLRELVGAVRQKEHDQKTLNDEAREQAEIKRKAIEKANNTPVEIKKPLFKRFFGGII